MSKIKRNIHNHTIQARTTRISRFLEISLHKVTT